MPYNFSIKTKDVDVDGQGQPLIINNRIFRNRIKNGFYIEAGAFDGEIRSNSLFYELKKGWNGLLVEPNPDAFADLKLKVISRKISKYLFLFNLVFKCYRNVKPTYSGIV